MNEHNRPDMQDWEAQVNDLLDGELGDLEAEALKDAAEHDRELARAIIEGYQLQQAMSAIAIERAPDSLRRKLRKIPREQAALARPSWFQPRWAAALAVIPLVVIVAVTQMGPKEPSEAEIAQAQQELKVAFAYLGKVGRRTGLEIENTVGTEMNDVVTDSMIKAVIEQVKFDKEQEA